MLNSRNKILALICIVLGLIGYYVLHDKENDTLILAIVGSSYISVDEFIKSYSFGSSQLKAKENPKLSYLEAMINERILAQDLSKNKKYSIEDSDSRIELLRKELIVEKIFENQVEDKVEILDEEVLKSILDAQKKIKISYLYSANYDQILECDHLINNGHDFDYIKNSLGQKYDLFINQTPFMNNNQIVETSALAGLTGLMELWLENNLIEERVFGYWDIHIHSGISRVPRIGGGACVGSR